jgi:hypothetical protein
MEDSFEHSKTRTLDSEKGIQIVSLDFDPGAIENLTRPQKNDPTLTRDREVEQL